MQGQRITINVCDLAQIRPLLGDKVNYYHKKLVWLSLRVGWCTRELDRMLHELRELAEELCTPFKLVDSNCRDPKVFAAKPIMLKKWLREGGYAWSFDPTSCLFLKQHKQKCPLTEEYLIRLPSMPKLDKSWEIIEALWEWQCSKNSKVTRT